MTTVSAGASGSYTFAANEQATISPTQGEACEVEVRRAGALIAGRRITTELSIGPFDAGDVMQLTAQRGAVDYTISTYNDTGIDTAESAALQALVSGARNLGGNSPYLTKRKATILESWAGKIKSVANGADYCTRVFRTLECHTDRLRVGIVNCVAADLVNVRVSVGTSDTMPADLVTLHGSTTTSGAILSNGGLANSAAFTALAGVDVNKPKITWSEWFNTRTVDRADGGTLPAVRITIEIPTAGNANRPAYDTSTTRAGWESQGSATVAPYGRCYKARNGAGLGVTTPSAGSSAVFSDETIPFVLEYVPRGGVVPVSLVIYGDSISEGAGATIVGHGWADEARAVASTPTAPMGVCSMAMASATQSNYADRVESVAADLDAALAILAMFTPNGITAPNFTESSTAPTQRQANHRARVALASAGTAVIGFSGIPMEPALKDLDASSAAVLTTFIGQVRNGNMPMIDAWGAMVGTADADGQFSCLPGSLADGTHPNSDSYKNKIAPAALIALRQFLIAPPA